MVVTLALMLVEVRGSGKREAVETKIARMSALWKEKTLNSYLYSLLTPSVPLSPPPPPPTISFSQLPTFSSYPHLPHLNCATLLYEGWAAVYLRARWERVLAKTEVKMSTAMGPGQMVQRSC